MLIQSLAIIFITQCMSFYGVLLSSIWFMWFQKLTHRTFNQSQLFKVTMKFKIGDRQYFLTLFIICEKSALI